ncbi:MAG TPA: anti-sigma factor [Solirubrobacteraceae bacterium]|nr:anti-sigma factor [Solirubrobacteraceae bacterium]
MLAPMRRLRFARDHRWTPGRLSAYVDGELGPRPLARVERHLAGCPQCLAALRGLERTLQALHRLGSSSPPEGTPDLAATVRQRLHEPPPDPRIATPPG